tara:strand:- start:369 stop:635 length:267 start_codon:yes stop_codon:yes gene_type:complete
MKIKINAELFSIFKEIIKENKSEAQWSEIESSDMYQDENFSGGFDATENAFCFSYYDRDREEYWFQVTLDETKKIIDGQINSVIARKI